MTNQLKKLWGLLALTFVVGVSAAHAQQVVLLDFDTGTDGTINYTQIMRDDIQDLMEGHYEDFNVSFTQITPASGDFSTLFFNSGNPGGLASKVDFRNQDMSDTAVINVDGFGLTTTADIVSATAIIGSHELGHLLGLRHGDSYGPPGFGLATSGVPGQASYNPPYPGFVAADEFNDHLMASPASVGSTLADVLTPSWFSERSATKLANNEQGSVQGEGPLMFDSLDVPNTIVSGDNAGLVFDVGSFVGEGDVSTSGDLDQFTFAGLAGDLFTFEVISEIIDDRVVDVLNPMITVIDPDDMDIDYYGTTPASNDDEFETDDSIIIDLVLPKDGTYTIEVEASSSVPSDTGQYELLGYRFAATEPPTCDANGPYVAECGLNVTLDGSDSSDPDDDPLTFSWTGPFSPSPATGEKPTVLFPGPTGNKTVTLEVDDGIATDSCTASVTVQDTLPPSLTVPGDITAECTAAGGTPVNIGTAAASDICDPNVAITNNAPALFPLGDTTVTWTATDDDGNQTVDTQVVTIEDTTPPELNVSVTPEMLWPPNHKMVTIHAEITASDTCDPEPMVRLSSITSSEPDNGKGDGNTVNDIQGADFGTGDRSFMLRAERQGKGPGRIYTITYQAEDSDNTTIAKTEVIVPKSQ